MNDVLEIAENQQKRAWQVLEETDILGIWNSIGATVNLVGSLRTGLLIGRRDIDLHIYTEPFRLSESFEAMARLAEKHGVKSIRYANLMEAEDRCVEWHAFYEDGNGHVWQMDMIHILNDSPYAGYFERVAERIGSVLTDETREAILSIKQDLGPERDVPGIEVCRAVLEGGVRDARSFREWRAAHPVDGIMVWMP
ncbi:MAG: phosphoglycerate mutase family protein [Syntrophobacteraceae bacterium]|nr:phosphoglycerate mutase family protein [Desulfobacteraceae bacterium]